LDNLATIAGNGFLSLYSGVTVTTTTTLTVQNGGVLQIDSGEQGGANQLTIGGDLIDQSGADGLSNGILVGNTAIAANDTLTVNGALLNQATGALTIIGGTGTDVSQAVVEVAGTMTDAGLITIDTDGLLSLAGGGSFTQTGGTTTISGTLATDNATLTAGMLNLNGGQVSAGILGIGGSASAFGFGSLDTALNNAGSIEASGGILAVEAVNGTGIFSVDANAILNFDGSVASGQLVTFNGTSAVVELSDAAGFQGTIAAFSTGGTIDLTSLNFVTGATATVSGGTLSVVSGGTTITLALSGVPDGTKFATTQDTVRSGTDVTISCFAAGTMIRTSRGDIAAEALSAGDGVLTAAGEEREIVWIGQRDIDCRRHPAPERVWPVRVAAGAFGHGLPCRDLFLSPDHAVFVDGVLIPVGRLIDGAGIKSVRRDTVSYFHIELARHDVLLAEGLPVESYLDHGGRSNFSNAGGVMRLFPDFSASLLPAICWEAMGCAPLIVTGPKVEAVRQRLQATNAWRSAGGFDAVSRGAFVPSGATDLMASRSTG